MRNSFPPSSGHRPPPTLYHNHNRNPHYHPPNQYCLQNHNLHSLGPTNSSSHPPPLLRPNFIIQLFSPTLLQKSDLDSLISTCNPSPEKKLDEIAEVSNLLKKRSCPVVLFSELNEKKKGLVTERDLIGKRVREFIADMHMSLLFVRDCDSGVGTGTDLYLSSMMAGDGGTRKGGTGG